MQILNHPFPFSNLQSQFYICLFEFVLESTPALHPAHRPNLLHRYVLHTVPMSQSLQPQLCQLHEGKRSILQPQRPINPAASEFPAIPKYTPTV